MPTDATGWGSFVGSVGFPVFLLIVVGYTLYRVAKWAAPHVEAVVQGHLHFLDTSSASITAMQESETRQGELLTKLTDCATTTLQHVESQSKVNSLILEQATKVAEGNAAVLQRIEELADGIYQSARTLSELKEQMRVIRADNVVIQTAASATALPAPPPPPAPPP